MTKKPKQSRVPVTRLDFRMVAHQGRCFLDLARPQISDLQAPLDVAASRAAKDIGKVVCAATLLALGIELLLKSIYAGRALPIPESHDLLELFRGLPTEIKKGVESRYVAKRAAADQSLATEIEIELVEQGNAFPDSSAATPATKPDYGLTALLARCADGFVVWRYYYESVPHDRPSTIKVFEHGPLLELADALNEFISANTLPAPPLVAKNAA